VKNIQSMVEIPIIATLEQYHVCLMVSECR